MEKLFNMVRPSHLSDVKGHPSVTNKVSRWIESGNIPSFILNYGCRGCGKTTVARIIARSANCENPTKDGPCGECPSCKAALLENNPDILELDAASKNKVEDVKALTEKLSYAPIYKKKVVILDEVHRLSGAAFDSLLKVLEEPPENVIFIFCTTELQKIPDTIISRARKLEYNSLPTSVIVDRLKEVSEKYGKSYEEEALLLIAKASKGAMRDAINFLEDFFEEGITAENVTSDLGLADDLATIGIIDAIRSGDFSAVSFFRDELSKGVRLQSFIDSVITVSLDLLQVISCKSVKDINGTDTYKEALMDLSGKVSFLRISEICDAFSEIRPYGLESSQVEAKIISLFYEESSLSRLETEISILKERIAKLETRTPSEPVLATKDVQNISSDIPFEEEDFEISEDTIVTDVETPEMTILIKDTSTSDDACTFCPNVEDCDGSNCIYDNPPIESEESTGESSIEDERVNDDTEDDVGTDETNAEEIDMDDFFSDFARQFK